MNQFILSTCLVLSVLLGGGLQAETPEEFYTENTIEWIVPYGPGGGYDQYSRLLAPFIEKHAGTTIKIKNLSGSGGLKGAVEIFRAPTNGLHMGVVNALALIGLEAASEDPLDYAMQEYGYIGRITAEERVLIVADKWKDATPQELAEADLVLGATGPGGTSYFEGFVAIHVLEAPWRLVSGFDSSSNLGLALQRGDIDGYWSAHSSALSRIQAGDVFAKMRLGVLSGEPYDEIPEIEPLATRDISLMTSWRGLAQSGRPVVATPGIPEDRLAYLRAAMAAAINDPEFQAAAAEAGRAIDFLDGTAALDTVRSAMELDDHARALLRQALGL